MHFLFLDLVLPVFMPWHFLFYQTWHFRLRGGFMGEPTGQRQSRAKSSILEKGPWTKK
jgi:hypothetical protein